MLFTGTDMEIDAPKIYPERMARARIREILKATHV